MLGYASHECYLVRIEVRLMGAWPNHVGDICFFVDFAELARTVPLIYDALTVQDRVIDVHLFF